MFSQNFSGGSADFRDFERDGELVLRKTYREGSAQERAPIEIDFLRCFTERGLDYTPVHLGDGSEDERIYLDMKFEHSDNLYDMMRYDGPLIGYIGGLAETAERLGKLHDEEELIHRDIKPANILYRHLDGKPVIIDFDLAIKIEDSKPTKRIAGTPLYMSPEQIRGEAIDVRSDLYNLVMSIYHLLAGKHPFVIDLEDEQEGINYLLKTHLKFMPAPLYNRGVSEGLSDVVMKGIAKDPVDRFQSGKELADALAKFI